MAVRALYDLPAPAKVNLFLHVVGRRADGYHLLQSVFVPIDWADTLHIERRADGRLARHDLSQPLPADDLTLQAARALQAATGCTQGADISIDKRVPSGAGLGGGSSDAATVLLALNRLWGLDLRREKLLKLAVTLGADVPFFVLGRPAFVEGIGERLTPVDVPPLSLAVVKPAASLPTALVFGHPALVRDTPTATIAGFLADAAKSGWSYGRNDLQPPAEDRCPEVAQAAQWLQRHFGNSRMTGSGSAVFARNGAADSPRLATWPAEGESLPPSWVGRMCRSLVRTPLADWAD
ncbi:MAG TPA: 4-(cytidine 5'-diphospho)-2-C-methyl-D-erythritol kinase [Burkholderiaceae bacterium]|nr:4-(cytidine 5'-diphospho)-2-C-methyl-D-erythritol kinase [Burkholderiaceae bacterium]